MDKEKVLAVLNELLEHELAGVVKYTHYSLMVYGPNRIPIVTWLREQGLESLRHAEEVGECITGLSGHPSLTVGDLLETHRHSTRDILQESMEHEEMAVKLYRKLLDLTKDHSIFLEEFARRLVCEEEAHLLEVQKMQRDSQ